MGRAKRDRTTGLPLPYPVVPEGTICIRITIPDATEYRQALKGALSDLGKPWTWRQVIGEDNSDAYTAAELWRAALQTAVYDDDCEDTVSCEDVANCIETDASTQSAIDTYVSNSETIIQTIGENSFVGVPMPESKRNSVITGSTGCDNDSLFGSITAITDQLHRNNEDFLEIIQLTDNAAERVSKILKAIPLVNELPIDEALDFASELCVELKENYDAEYTSTTRDEIRCALFCKALEDPDCELTFQGIIEVFNDRVGTALEPVNFFVELVEFLLLGTWPGTVLVDVMHLLQLAVWQQASSWSGISLRTLQTVGLLGANDDDPDWSILCTDCPEVWEHTFDFTLGTMGWTVNAGQYISGVGIQNNTSAPTPYTTDVSKSITWGGAVLTRVRVACTSTIATSGGFRGIYNEGFTNVQSGYSSNTGPYTMDFNPPTGTAPVTLYAQNSNQPAEGGTNVIVSITLNGTGTEPTW